jgi:hypothetical protein
MKNCHDCLSVLKARIQSLAVPAKYNQHLLRQSGHLSRTAVSRRAEVCPGFGKGPAQVGVFVDPEMPAHGAGARLEAV